MKTSGLRELVAVSLLVWVFLLVIAAQTTVWDRDEARFATAALEMAASGNWLYPTFNGNLRPHQPILVYWLMAGMAEVFGMQALALRVVPATGAATAVFFTGLIARQLFGSKAGWRAAVFLGTSPMILATGAMATTDAVLLAFWMGSSWIFVHAWVHGHRPWDGLGLSWGFAAAFLTKGPVALLLPLSFATALLIGRPARLKGFGWTLAGSTLCGLALFFAWALPANAATGGQYGSVAITERLTRRLFTAMEGHGGEAPLDYLLHLPFYLLVLALAFLPWTFYLPSTFGFLKSRWKSDAGILFAGMVLPTFVVMTLMVSKLPHYIQPVLPWLAVMVGGCLAEKPALSRLEKLSPWLLTIALVPACFAAAWFLPSLAPAIWIFGGLGVLAGVMLGLATNKIPAAAFPIAQAMGLILLIAVGWINLGPAVDRLVKPASVLVAALPGDLLRNARFAALGWKEPGMHFALQGRHIEWLETKSDLTAWAAEPGILIAPETELSKPEIREITKHWRVLAGAGGVDHAKGGSIRLVALQSVTRSPEVPNP